MLHTHCLIQQLALTSSDFFPLLYEILLTHPSLRCLALHPHFQRKYSLTVITRIFWACNVSRTGRLSLRELRLSNLVSTLFYVDRCNDINLELCYFNYAHFYVLFHTFLALDKNQDHRLHKADLLGHYRQHDVPFILAGSPSTYLQQHHQQHLLLQQQHSHVQHAQHPSSPSHTTAFHHSQTSLKSLTLLANSSYLSRDCVDLLFTHGEVALSDGKQGFATGMAYPDFIFFMLNEVGKGGSVMSAKYWMKCISSYHNTSTVTSTISSLSRQDLLYAYRMQCLRLTTSTASPSSAIALSPNKSAVIVDGEREKERWREKVLSFDDFASVLHGVLSLPLTHPQPAQQDNSCCDKERITWEDLENALLHDHSTHALTFFFELLLSPSHFLAWWLHDDSRDYLHELTTKKREDWRRSDWDRFAEKEYRRLIRMKFA
jgi:hypothetical protein